MSKPPRRGIARNAAMRLASSNPSYSLMRARRRGKRRIKYVSTRLERQSPFVPSKNPLAAKEIACLRAPPLAVFIASRSFRQSNLRGTPRIVPRRRTCSVAPRTVLSTVWASDAV
jgi:hypothetical protein